MPVIKRYLNRKLYDTEAKQYVTLQEIAALIRQGKDVQVIDQATGEDLTALTLAQIISEQEKKPGGFLPPPVLTSLVQAGGETLSAMQRTLASSLGLVQQVDEEIERRIRMLIGQGELTEQEGRQLRNRLLSLGPSPTGPSGPDEQRLRRSLKRKLPTRRELQKLVEQIEALTAQLDELSQRADRA